MKNKLSFFVMEKDFNTGEVKPFDVMPTLYAEMYNKSGKLSKNFYSFDRDFNRVKITTKDALYAYIKRVFMYHFWSKCEWEFIVIDWPYRPTKDGIKLQGEDAIIQNRPNKMDVYKQIEPNLPLITDLVWNEVKDLISC